MPDSRAPDEHRFVPYCCCSSWSFYWYRQLCRAAGVRCTAGCCPPQGNRTLLSWHIALPHWQGDRHIPCRAPASRHRWATTACCGSESIKPPSFRPCCRMPSVPSRDHARSWGSSTVTPFAGTIHRVIGLIAPGPHRSWTIAPTCRIQLIWLSHPILRCHHRSTRRGHA